MIAVQGRAGVRYGSALLLVIVVTAVLSLFRDSLTPANFSLVYLLVVLVSAVYIGVGPSVFATVVSFLCFNFFLIEPLYTLHVADPRDVLNLVVYLVAAALAGQVASYARTSAEDARQKAYEQNILYRVTSAFNQLTDRESIFKALQQVLHENFAIQQVDVFPHEMKEFPPDQRSLFLVLRVGETVYGTLRVVLDRAPSSSLRRLLTTCTVQASLALQRVELAQRAQRSRSFEEADRLKTALLHAVSHDLRTPITIIKTSASNLLKLKLPEDEQIETLKVIENEADQLDKMVGNLLDISRLKAGVLRINAVWNSLEEAAGDVAAMVWQRTGKERIKICFPDNMPLVQFDYALILQALSNLTENSLRYEPDDKRVEICGRIEGSEAQVIVANHGPSIPTEERELIMEPFYHGTGGNIGLGLAIAKGIVEAHHGRLWVEDTPGGGATFVVSLPLSAIPADLAEKVEKL